MQSRDVKVASIREALPPHSVDLEEAIAGGLVADPNAIERVAHLLTPEDFYCEPFRLVFEAALNLFQEKRPADLLTILAWLDQQNRLHLVGGQEGLFRLMESTVSAASIDLYAKELRTLRIRRDLIQCARQQAELARNPTLSLEDVISQCATRFNQATHAQLTHRGRNISEVCQQIFEEMEKGIAKGIDTDLYDLNALTGGLHAQELVVIAGATGMGKTQLAVYLAYKALVQGYPVMFFSCEMADIRIGERLLAHVAGIDSSRVHQKNIFSHEWDLFIQAQAAVAVLPFRLCDERRLTPALMRSELNECTARFGSPGLIILDYLQLLGGDKQFRVQELDLISRECRAIAQEFNACFVALAQINRGVANRSEKRPTLADLRESGSIEMNADRVILLYRDEYYDKNSADRGLIEVNVAKNRYDSSGTFKALFQPQFSEFKNLAKEWS